MKPFLRIILLAVATAALPSAFAADAAPNLQRRVERLDELVHLSAGQKSQVAQIFTKENAALQAFTDIEERMTKGMPIRQAARAEVRAVLTPAQQKIYDISPQRLGGGAMQDPAARASRLDKVVTLTDRQTLQVAGIMQRELEDVQALPPAERVGPKAAAIRQAAKAKVRALLTPEQQQKYDANPNGAEDLEERAFVVQFLTSSPRIAARLGTVTRVSPTTATIKSMLTNEQVQSIKGDYTYEVQGSLRTETLKVSWERTTPSAPIKILGIQTSAGESLPL